MPPKIYVFANGKWRNDFVGLAIAEDGNVLSNHISSSETWLTYDLGVISMQRHDKYGAHYPDGFAVEYVPFDQVETHVGLLAAVQANAALAQDGQGVGDE